MKTLPQSPQPLAHGSAAQKANFIRQSMAAAFGVALP